jgi:ubiquitin-like-conjugating enzyme ATG3
MAAQDLYNNIYSRFHSVREYLAPILKDSKFKETGCLTPEEVNAFVLWERIHMASFLLKFVAAGEFLVYKCPTWSW